MGFELEYLKKAARGAILARDKYGVAPIISLAQGALESDWGRSWQAKNISNYHGLTYGSGTGPHHIPNTYYTTSRGLKFRKYPSVEDAFLDFGYFLKNFKSYEKVRPHLMDFNRYAEAIAASKYIAEENGDDRALYLKGLYNRAGRILEVTGNGHLVPKPQPSTTSSGADGGVKWWPVAAGLALAFAVTRAA